MKKYCFGVDVGGTSVKIGLFTTDGEVEDKWEIKTRKENAGANILADIAASLNEKLESKHITKEEIEGVGIGVPGPIKEDGTVLSCVNLGWGEFNVKDEMKKLSGFDNIKVNNDANVAALGEMWQGGGRGYKNIIMVTLGTGVGGGVIYGGKILSGVRGAAGEIGHMTVNPTEIEACNCGKHGCLEQFASATGIVKEAKRLLELTDRETILRGLKSFSAKDVLDGAKQGDKVSLEVVDKLGSCLGMILSHVAAVIDPEAFVIGGGVSRAGDILTDVIKKHYEENVMIPLKGKIFHLAELGNDAGIYGSARMVLD